MANVVALSYLWTTLTQGSADAFIQATVSTGLFGQTKIAYRLREILLEFSSTQGVAGTSSQWEVSLTRKSFAAMPTTLEKSLIWKWKRSNVLVTSGMVTADTAVRVTFQESDNILVVEDPIYAQLDSNGTSATNVVYLRLGYERVAVSDVDRLTLIANSLAA